MFNLFKKKKQGESKKLETNESAPKRSREELAVRKGEIGEHKIDIQLSQLPKEYKYLNDLMVKNPKSKSGYSQIDHVILTPYGIFVIETKNYQGTIYGGKDRKTWLVNGKFPCMNPFHQNYGHIKALNGLIDSNDTRIFISIVSFTKRCTFKVEQDLRRIRSDQLIVYDIELSEFINRKVAVQKLLHQQALLTEEQITNICQVFQNANITDKKIRKFHHTAINQNTESMRREAPAAKPTCTICKKAVPQKVLAYCLSNKKFNGKVYCYEHQRQVLAR